MHTRTLHEMQSAIVRRAAKDYIRDSKSGPMRALPGDYLWQTMGMSRRSPDKLVESPEGRDLFLSLGEAVIKRVEELAVDPKG